MRQNLKSTFVMMLLGAVGTGASAQAFDAGMKAYYCQTCATTLENRHPAATRRSSRAQAYVAEFSPYGKGAKQTVAAPAKRYGGTAEQDSESARYALREMQAKGRDVAKDPDEAGKRYPMSAEARRPIARNPLAKVQADALLPPKKSALPTAPSVEGGDSLSKERHSAPSILDAVRERSDRALELLARGLEKVIGHSHKPNYGEAARSFEKAAALGNAEAQFWLGYLYDEGLGVDQSYFAAMALYKISAKNGVLAAQNNLGILYYYGRSEPQDFSLAYRWWRVAAEQGLKSAKTNLPLAKNNMDDEQASFEEEMGYVCTSERLWNC